MSKRELTEARAQISELRKLLRQLAPGSHRRRDGLWGEIRRLTDHARWLADMSVPMPTRPVPSSTANNSHTGTAAPAAAGGRSADRALFPGTWLEPEEGRRGDRNIYHTGRAFDRELDRLIKGVANLTDRSEDWVRGLNNGHKALPQSTRERCTNCGETLAISWRYCPYCAQPRPADATKVSRSVR